MKHPLKTVTAPYRTSAPVQRDSSMQFLTFYGYLLSVLLPRVSSEKLHDCSGNF